jgi:hypothetical protein
MQLVAPVLRLPIEIRLQIALLLQEPPPKIEEAAKAASFEHYLLKYSKRRKNARAILKVPGFRGLKKRYPYAFEGRAAMLFAYQYQRRCRDMCSLLEEELATGVTYQPFGLHPLSSRFLRAVSTGMFPFPCLRLPPAHN